MRICSRLDPGTLISACTIRISVVPPSVSPTLKSSSASRAEVIGPTTRFSTGSTAPSALPDFTAASICENVSHGTGVVSGQ